MKQLFTKAKLKKIETLCRKLIILLGDDPDRPGMIKTPERYAKACAEWFEGMQYTNEEIAEKFNTCFDGYGDDLQLIKGIPVRNSCFEDRYCNNIFSTCEHHMALMYDMSVSVAYIPHDGKVIGLSKVYRIAELAAKRFQIQEKLCEDICDIISMVTQSDDVMVVVKGKHACVTSRGVKKDGPDSVFISSRVTGLFKTNSDLRNEVNSMINK